jgi:acyl-CoA synthetase (AMP-forming)/AMP-acid ligase II
VPARNVGRRFPEHQLADDLPAAEFLRPPLNTLDVPVEKLRRGSRGHQDTSYCCTVIEWVPVAGGSGSLAGHVEAADASEPAIECGGSDNLFIMYTSGTTGHPKGVVHIHDSVHTAATSNALTAVSRYQDRILLPLPMFHVAALTTVIFGAMRGITLISMPQLDPAKMWSPIIEERVSIAGAVPAILNFMRQVPEFAELNAHRLPLFHDWRRAQPRP